MVTLYPTDLKMVGLALGSLRAANLFNIETRKFCKTNEGDSVETWRFNKNSWLNSAREYYGVENSSSEIFNVMYWGDKVS